MSKGSAANLNFLSMSLQHASGTSNSKAAYSNSIFAGAPLIASSHQRSPQQFANFVNRSSSTGDLKSLHHEAQVLFQGLRIDKAVLDSTSFASAHDFPKF